ncbi:amino acid adenylation domain-containing protein [Aquimarina sp. 2-A2]|uniref:amino acid adenylation domain-containing protein n=1 Tax=Aquimarina sp. 2-A2 TaxID=3382644 RepID=UPI00387F0992
MDKLTQFFNELLTNTETFNHFNSGATKGEIANNRKRMLHAAGVEHSEEIIKMSAQDLQKFMEKELFPKSGEIMKTTISELIIQQMLAHPERMAIIDGNTNIEYKDLMKRASEVAGELNNRKVVPGSLVGVCMSRTWELVATLIGVMQAGCAYVPLDPAYPQDRVQYMLEHSRAVAAIVDTDKAAALCKGVRELLWLNSVGSHTDATIRPSENDLAYVIYTSGSTGRPKGVAVEHKNVVAMLQSMREKFSDEELKGVFAGASVCFDTSVMEIMGTLSLGGTIILAKNALELTTLPAADQLRTVVIVASALQALLTTETLPKGLRCLVFGGEALKRSVVEQVYALAPNLRILNAYGPTEDTVYSTLAEIPSGVKIVTIGKSVANSRAYILDDVMQPVPVGEAGELYLAGSKLARGYLYDEALTKERFIEREPCDLIPDNRLYKTGDLCRWTENKEIEFLGRVDQQVKIRGFRIELEEIESALESMEGVDAAAAAALDGGIGQKILVVYVVSRDAAVTEVKVKSYLSERLPKYMVPQIVRHLESLPFLPNDKLDRKKLVSMETEVRIEHGVEKVTPGEHTTNGTGKLVQQFVGSKNNQQAAILSIIQNELASILNFGDPKDVMPDDAFENMGLDSLSTLEFSSRLSKVLGQEVSAQKIFEYTTPNALANYIITTAGSGPDNHLANKRPKVARDTLASFQINIQSSHPTFQAANASSWSANDKSKLVQEFMHLVNNNRRNPYGKVLQTGSAARGTIGDSYTNEKQEAIIWSTNLYFGLNRDPQVIEEASNALARYGTGMGISAAATGMTTQHLEFEKEFADLVGKPSACLFPTGYTANLGAISGLLGQNDVVVIDQLCHASIVDGARLSGATMRTFKHNNASDLAAVLESEVSPYRTVLVVLESVYSMGEGTAPVAEIVRTAKKYDALVLVDEAHSFGFYGENGAGVCAAQGVTKVDFIMTTLSKALGSIGGVIAASQQHIDLLKSSSRAYIFQASISPADIAAGLASLRRLRSDDTLRKQLWDTTRYMREQFEEAGYDLGTGDGPIVTPHFGDKDKLYAIVQGLYERGVQTLAVTYPIVEIGRGRLRFICSASHTRDDIDKTVKALIEAEREVEEQFLEKKDKKKDITIKSADLVVWADAFTDFLKKSIAEVTVSTPNLAIAVSVSEQSEPITILVKDGEVVLNGQRSCDVSYCSMLLTDKQTVTALQSSDVQGLLNGICEGTCVLKGQVEPFIWFIGRMVEQRESAHVVLE